MIIMKKLIVVILCTVMSLMLVACSGNSVTDSQADAQIPNPFVDFKTLEEAQKLAGFDITLPDNMPEGYSKSAIRAVKDTMIEIIYRNGENEIRIRKGAGSEDISGAYNEYTVIDTVTVGNLQVTMKGNDGKVNVAIWVDGEYTFAITINLEGAGFSKDVVSDMVNSVK
jgi:hypothetical protein